MKPIVGYFGYAIAVIDFPIILHTIWWVQFIYLCFVLLAESGSQIYSDYFQDVKVKDEPLEPDTVSYKHKQQSFIFITIVWWLVI